MSDEPFSAPSVTRAAQVLGVGYLSAQKNIDRLVKTGIVWEISGRAQPDLSGRRDHRSR